MSIDYAREHLDELIERAARGEDVRIADPRHGSIRLLPAEGQPVPLTADRVPGRWKGRLPPPPDDFFDPLDEKELALWYGEDS